MEVGLRGMFFGQFDLVPGILTRKPKYVIHRFSVREQQNEPRKSAVESSAYSAVVVYGKEFSTRGFSAEKNTFVHTATKKRLWRPSVPLFFKSLAEEQKKFHGKEAT
jgi:hypothetical protein